MVGKETTIMPPSIEPMREMPDILATMSVALHFEMVSVLALLNESLAR